MGNFTDQNYLRSDQYRDETNLNARIDLHKRFSTNPLDWMIWLFDQMQFNTPCRILELGGGTGTLWEKNLSRVPSDWHIFLSDLSAGMVSKARESLRRRDLQFEFLVIDAQQVPFPSEHFDGVIANHVLFHMPDLHEALAEIHRILREGGRFYASTIGRGHLRELHALLARFSGKNQSPESANPSIFTLQNGTEQLSPFFSQVKVLHYDDSLNITEAGPLFAYVQSMMTETSAIQGEDEITKEFEQYVEDELNRNQSIIVTKDQGLFSAIRKDGT
jgi:ubiquinone/menaquinone biosynthesis C-methylase UbiE